MIDCVALMMSTRSASLRRGRAADAREGISTVYRLRRLVLASLALLCAFVIVAGIAIVRLLPPRLDQWDVPTVGTRALATGQPPLAAAGSPPGAGGAAATAPGPSPAGLRAVLEPLLGSPVLGPH